jgi:hypothetical protein|tara:strand:- start:47 stop:574 length:528 start_codon:yes stop_codon:yes gene_type:complete
VGQEYFINSQELEDKIRSLLPSQGGAGAGFDLSASTQIIPVIDVTESAEGSNVRQDLQTAISHSITPLVTAGGTATIISNTGYFRVFGNCSIAQLASGDNIFCQFQITDGVTAKRITGFQSEGNSSLEQNLNIPFDFNIFVSAGESVLAVSSTAKGILYTATRQIADIDGNLINP